MPLLPNGNDTSKNNVVIVGKAYNEKDGAWVLSKDNKNYFLNGLESWDEKNVGKKIKVWGRLLIEESKEKNREIFPTPGIPPTPIPQKREDTFKRIILKVKWKLIR